MLQIKTTIDLGEDGIPLEPLGEITKLLKGRHLGAVSKVQAGFVPIQFDRYVDLHVRSNPSVDRAEFARRLRQAVDARKAGARCACGAFIWAIGSAEAGAACFTCITGEAWPDSDYEIESVGLSARLREEAPRRHRVFQDLPTASLIARIDKNMGVGAGRASDRPSTASTATNPNFA